MPQASIALRIPEDINKTLDEYARLIDRPKSWLIRKGIDAIIQEMEDMAIANERLNDPHAKYRDFDEIKKELNLR
jgi:RHH-type transcriptional regulator, rel operon repressor / antitoxin RelB